MLINYLLLYMINLLVEFFLLFLALTYNFSIYSFKLQSVISYKVYKKFTYIARKHI